MEIQFIDPKKQNFKLKKAVVSLGGFDGIHLGHQALIKKLISAGKEKGAPSCLCLFDPLPFQVLTGKSHFKRLFTIPELESFLKNFDFDFLFIIPFDISFSKLSPKEFIYSVLMSYFNPLHIIVGYDFSFSHQNAGQVNHAAHLIVFLMFPVSRLTLHQPC